MTTPPLDLPAEAIERFWSRVNKTPTCWLWTGSHTTAGYGNLAIRQRFYYCHRLAYELLVGPIPTGLVLDHLCRVRDCCNPAHLEPVTDRVNVQRGMGGYGLRTTCKHGHDITDESNVYVQPDGGRRCRPCGAAYSRANAEIRNAHKRAKRRAA